MTLSATTTEVSARVESVSGAGPYTITLSAAEPAKSNASFYSGQKYIIPYLVQSHNVILLDHYTSAGINYGWAHAGSAWLPSNGPNNVFKEGGSTSLGSFFANNGQSNSPIRGSGNGFHTHYAYAEYSHNVAVANSSRTNTTHTPTVGTSYIIRLLAQGSGFRDKAGPFPGSIATMNIVGNYVDPKGSFGCINISSQGVYTAPANGIISAPRLTNNIDLLDNSTWNSPLCHGSSNP